MTEMGMRLMRKLAYSGVLTVKTPLPGSSNSRFKTLGNATDVTLFTKIAYFVITHAVKSANQGLA